MLKDKYYDDILAYLTENGETGVNVLSSVLGIPLSSLQRYLERQSYFRKTINRKWDLPDNVETDIKTNTLTMMVDSVEISLKLLGSQLEELQQSVQNSLSPINTLKRAVANTIPSVADKNGQNIDKRLSQHMEMSNTLHSIFKKQKNNIPEELHNLFFNFDYIGLILKEGEDYTKQFLEEGTYELLAGKTQELSEDVIQILKDNQKDK